MRTKNFETCLKLNSNLENFDIDMKKYLKNICKHKLLRFKSSILFKNDHSSGEII